MILFPEVCTGGQIPNGKLYPERVIEGSVVTLKCDKDFRTEGVWQLTCTNRWLKGMSSEEVPKCVPLREGKLACHQKINLAFKGFDRLLKFFRLLRLGLKRLQFQTKYLN